MDERNTQQPAQPKMGLIFLSYSGADRDAATRLKQGLREAGVEVWQDTDQIHIGDRWIDDLQTTLRQSSAYLILVGASGVHHWVTAELSYAIKRHFDTDGGLPIYPLLLPGVAPEDLPPLLSLFQAQQRAAFSRGKQAPLRRANLQLEITKHLWRLTHKLQVIPSRRYEHSAM